MHQSLTGLRGLIMPLAGAMLYRHVVGWHIVWISAVGLVIASLGYRRMHAMRRAQSS